MSPQKRFSQQDLSRIKAAVHDAESKISGEIVPVFVEKSGHYTVATYRGGAILAGIVFLFIVFFERYISSEIVYDPLLMLIVVLAAGLVGGLLANFIPAIKKLLLGQLHLDQSTRKRAESAFLQQEVFNTRQRTGILIFISFFEHEVIVMADRGISKVVEQKEWDAVVRLVIENVKKGKLVDGIEAAVKRCGDILLEKGFLITPDDINELSDDLRVE